MELTFWGAARVVTGSMHLLEIEGARYMLDCGQFQGRRREAAELNGSFPCAPEDVSAVVVSHAHIDHTGVLPLFVKEGFHGPIFASPASVDLCRPMLLDSAHIQESDAAYLNRRQHRRKAIGVEGGAAPVEPLYTTEDAEAVFPLFRKVSLHERTELGAGVTYEPFDAGHMLGSTFVLLRAEERGRAVRILYSGDLGRPGLPIIRDPEPPPAADYLILESTYGDRLHKPIQAVNDKLSDIVKRTYGRGGKLIVPAFAVGRTQQVVMTLHELVDAKAIPDLPVFVDSPLALEVTQVFRKHSEMFDGEARGFYKIGEEPFAFPRLRYLQTVDESKALNDLHGPYTVIASSGMCESGRILHHLKNNIGDPRNTVLLTGYQAENTLGRKIEQKRPEVPVFGEMMPLRAQVERIDEFSGHADRRELLEWMAPIAGGLRRVFLVHGEPDQQRALAEAIRERFGVEAVAPERGETVDL